MRLRTRLLTLAAIPILGLGAALATAGAASASDNANGATLYAGNYQCDGASAAGANLSQPQGFVNYHETGNQLTLVIHIKDALPDTTYAGFMYDAFCTPDFDGPIPNITTNDNGVGNATVTVTVRPGMTYFLTEYNLNAFSTATSMQTKAITP
jgi:hypothetical protein